MSFDGSFFVVFIFNIAMLANNGNAISRNREWKSIDNNSSLVSWSNRSTIRLKSNFREKTNESAIDCFGLGSTVARSFDWWFKPENTRANSQDIRFSLSSRKQPRRVQIFTGHQFGLEWTDFVVERRTVVIVHGFLSSGTADWVRRIEEAFLLWGDVNVIVVDWSTRANTFNYYRAVANTQVIGSEISRLLHHIVNATIAANSSVEPKWGTLHLLGHSLGAHICGFAAQELRKRQTKWNVARITGFDPAHPCFNNATFSLRLDRDDAPFVDVIHTNGKLEDSFSLGLPEPIGHVDFYPNGGRRQPGCAHNSGTFADYVPMPKALVNQAVCSHGRSYEYFTESLASAAIGNCTFWAQHWDRSFRNSMKLMTETCKIGACTEMGIRAELYPHRGCFFLVTSQESPFCASNDQDKQDLMQQLQSDYANEILD